MTWLEDVEDALSLPRLLAVEKNETISKVDNFWNWKTWLEDVEDAVELAERIPRLRTALSLSLEPLSLSSLGR